VDAPPPEARRRPADHGKSWVLQIVPRGENDKLKAQVGPGNLLQSRHEDAAQLMVDLFEQRKFAEFLTLPTYGTILADANRQQLAARRRNVTRFCYTLRCKALPGRPCRGDVVAPTCRKGMVGPRSWGVDFS
jgi:hypothetical protein